EDRANEGADDDERDARIKKQPRRAVEQEKAEVTPAVPPCAQVRWTIAAVGRERDRHLAQAQIVDHRLHDHLARELHAGRAQIASESPMTTKRPRATSTAPRTAAP